MTVYPSSEYKFVRFKKSKNPNKKYTAILINKKTNRTVNVNFGSTMYQQYKDSTGLNFYSKYDHLDKERKKRYKLRHKGEGDNNKKYSSAWFSYWYLWT
jgi:hypothetical protein